MRPPSPQPADHTSTAKQFASATAGPTVQVPAAASHSTRVTTPESSVQSNALGIDPVNVSALTDGIDFSDLGAFGMQVPTVATPGEVIGALQPSDLELLSDIATFKYLAASNALFNNLLTNTDERLNQYNIGPYSNFVKRIMRYYGEWKQGQLRRKDEEDDDWVESFLAKETWENLRVAASGGMAFAKYAISILCSVDESFEYLTMMLLNQTTLEGSFSFKRLSGQDKGSTYAIGNTNECVKMNECAMMRSSYCAGDLCEERDGLIVGSSYFAAPMKKVDKAVNKWKSKWEPKFKATRTSAKRFGCDYNTTNESVRALFDKISRLVVQGGYLFAILSWENFQHWMRLSIGSDTEPWFDAILEVDESEFQSMCHKMMLHLFKYMESFMVQSKSDYSFYEFRVYEYIISDEFVSFYEKELPLGLRNNRMGAIILIRTLSELLEQWFVEAMIEIATAKRPPQSTTVPALEKDDINDLIHSFVGAGIRKCTHHFEDIISTGNKAFKTFYSKSVAIEATEMLKIITLEGHQQAASDLDYIKNFYPTSIQLLNEGGLLLLKKNLFPWAAKLMISVRAAVTDDNMHQYKKNAINFVRAKVINDKSIGRAFKKAIESVDAGGSFSDEAMSAVHDEIMGYCLEAFTGAKFKDLFSKKNKEAGDTSKVAHRAKLRISGSSAERGGGGTSSRKRKREGEKVEKLKKEYQDKLHGALKKLKDNGNDAKKLRSKAECCAVLYYCYGPTNFYDSTSTKLSCKLGKLQDYLEKEISANASKLNICNICDSEVDEEVEQVEEGDDEDNIDVQDQVATLLK